jgi:hypothetical protein
LGEEENSIVLTLSLCKLAPYHDTGSVSSEKRTLCHYVQTVIVPDSLPTTYSTFLNALPSAPHTGHLSGALFFTVLPHTWQT